MYVLGHDMDGARELSIVHKERKYIGIHRSSAQQTCKYIRELWGYPVHLDILYTDRAGVDEGIIIP